MANMQGECEAPSELNVEAIDHSLHRVRRCAVNNGGFQAASNIRKHEGTLAHYRVDLHTNVRWAAMLGIYQFYDRIFSQNPSGTTAGSPSMESRMLVITHARYIGVSFGPARIIGLPERRLFPGVILRENPAGG